MSHASSRNDVELGGQLSSNCGGNSTPENSTVAAQDPIYDVLAARCSGILEMKGGCATKHPCKNPCQNPTGAACQRILSTLSNTQHFSQFPAELVLVHHARISYHAVQSDTCSVRATGTLNGRFSRGKRMCTW